MKNKGNGKSKNLEIPDIYLDSVIVFCSCKTG